MLLFKMYLLLEQLVKRLPEKFGEFYSYKQVAQNLFKAAEEGIVYSDYWRKLIPKVNKLHLSGCEPTIGKKHLLAVLGFVRESEYSLFILEASGIILGNDRDTAKIVAFNAQKPVRQEKKALMVATCH